MSESEQPPTNEPEGPKPPSDGPPTEDALTEVDARGQREPRRELFSPATAQVLALAALIFSLLALVVGAAALARASEEGHTDFRSGGHMYMGPFESGGGGHGRGMPHEWMWPNDQNGPYGPMQPSTP
jgi:hypothetical protein